MITDGGGGRWGEEHMISAKEIMFSVALWFVCSSVFVSVCLLATLLKRLWMDCADILLCWNFFVLIFFYGSEVTKGTSDEILVVIWITILTVQLEWLFLNKLWADCDEISGYLFNDTRNNLLNFWGDLDHHADSPNRLTGQYGGNELPWQRSALSEYSCSLVDYCSFSELGMGDCAML